MGLRSASVVVTLGVAVALGFGAWWVLHDAAEPPGADQASAVRSGGVLRIITPVRIDGAIDPALTEAGGASWVLAFAVCGTLMSFRNDGAPGDNPVQPEAAAAMPTVSRDERTYVFTLRPGLRFSDGRPLTAANFEAALDRLLDPAMRAYGALLFADVKRVTADGRRLRIELTRPAGDLVVRMALPYTCPVPVGLPAQATTPLIGSGPYSIVNHTPRRLVVERNRHYAGPRPARLDGFVFTFADGGVEESVRAVGEGRADLLGVEIPPEMRPALIAEYGVNKAGGQLFRIAGTVPYPLVLNTSRPLFRHNAALRKAVNYALSRDEIMRADDGGAASSRTTDQIITPAVPGYVDHDLYPLTGPDLRRARELAEGNTRGGKAVLYVFGIPRLLDRARIIVRNLSEIGLRVTVKPLSPAALYAKVSTPGEPYDMLLTVHQLEYPDPANLIVRLLDGANARRPAGNTNAAYFDDPRYNRRIAAANRLPIGAARQRAFADLEADLMRNEAPWAPLWEGSRWLLLSKRVGCVKPHPIYRIDFGAVCLT